LAATDRLSRSIAPLAVLVEAPKNAGQVEPTAASARTTPVVTLKFDALHRTKLSNVIPAPTAKKIVATTKTTSFLCGTIDFIALGAFPSRQARAPL
jgi:hypothetical protein